MTILTHRGLDPSRAGYFAESSCEAFADQLARGFGLEFDPRRAPDGRMVIAHRAEDIAVLGSHIVTLRELLTMIRERGSVTLHAVHVKADMQNMDFLDELCRELTAADPEQLLLFDLTVPSAQFVKRRNSGLHLAPSVSHSYDIERYNSAVGGTLLTLEEALAARNLYDWVWLDEWGRADHDGKVKTFYTHETFLRLREASFHIALVAPELHAASPHLLGGESHQDAVSRAVLERRLKEIIALGPDALCTDYPDMVRMFLPVP